MTPLRQRMIREMQLQQFSPRTIDCLRRRRGRTGSHYRRSPEQLDLEEIRSYLHHLLVERQLAQGTCNVRAAAITFSLSPASSARPTFVCELRRKHSGKLPEVYSREELVRLFDATAQLVSPRLPDDHLRRRPASVRSAHLKPIHIHSERMLIRVEQGKGHKDRYTLLSPQLLLELREYWKEYRPGEWLFPNQKGTGPIAARHGPEDLLRRQGAGRSETRPWHPHPAPLLRHASARSRRRSAHHSIAPGTSQSEDDRALSARDREEARATAKPLRPLASAATRRTCRPTLEPARRR